MQKQNELPQRTRHYKGVITDTNRWDAFSPRNDDIFICSLSKNGTTWMQTICTFLVFGTADLDFVPADRSTWLDATFEPIEDLIVHFDKQTNRRIIKTHTPLDGIPFYPRCTYITVWRDPRDAYLSLRTHLDNMSADLGERGLDLPPDEAFLNFIESKWETEATEVASLDYVGHFINSYFEFKGIPNLHFFHYADMKHDLKSEISKIAKVLEIEVSQSKLDEYAEAATFSSMKKNALGFVPGADRGHWRKPEEFLSKGTSGQWQGVFSDKTLQRFEERFDELVGADLARWIKRGSGNVG